MTIYAIFICIANLNQCQLADPPHMTIMGTYAETTYYRTKAECQRALPPQPGTRNLHYVCLGKHVDTWH